MEKVKTTTNRTPLLLLTLILAFGMVLTACEGPAGEQGPQGPEGQQGEQGPQGDEGTANVIYSEWMDFDWNMRDDDTYKSMTIPEERVSNNLMNTGMIKMYLKSVANTVDGDMELVVSLPYISNSHKVSFSAVVTTNNPDAGNLPPDFAGLFIANSSTDGSPVPNYNEAQIRYVMIPGGVPAKIPPDFWEDYEAVADYYRIPD